MEDKRLTDVLLICKGWYNKNLYQNILEALNAYYHKYYGCDNISMDKNFAMHLFLQPLALKAIEIKPTLAKYIFNPICPICNCENESYTDRMYKQLLGLIMMITSDMFDLNDYQNMIKKAEDSHYQDKTIGII
mgnify:CR=1 FL=1